MTERANLRLERGTAPHHHLEPPEAPTFFELPPELLPDHEPEERPIRLRVLDPDAKGLGEHTNRVAHRELRRSWAPGGAATIDHQHLGAYWKRRVEPKALVKGESERGGHLLVAPADPRERLIEVLRQHPVFPTPGKGEERHKIERIGTTKEP